MDFQDQEMHHSQESQLWKSSVPSNEEIEDFLRVLNTEELSVNNLFQKRKSDQNVLTTVINKNDYNDILTPQKVETNISRFDKNQSLIDVGEDRHNEKSYNETNSSSLSGSMLETKPKFDLIDLYENILVTPHHFSKERETYMTVKDLDNFFGTVGQKQVDILNKGTNGNTFNDFHESQNCYMTNKNDKILSNMGSVIEYNMNKYNPTIDKNNTAVYDDIFDKMVIRNNNPAAKTTIYKNNAIVYEDTFDKLIISNDENSAAKTTLRNNSANLEKRENSSDIEDMFDEVLNMKVVNAHFNKNNIYPTVHTKSNSIKKNANVVKNTNHIASTFDVEQYTNSNLNTKVKIMDTVENINNTRFKQPQTRNKTNLVKGPDYFEKLIETPPILERIAARKKKLDKRNKERRVPTLDSENKNIKIKLSTNSYCPKQGKVKNTDKDKTSLTGSIHKTVKEVTLNPVVLMEDSKKVRLTALKQRQLFDDIVFGGE